MSEGQHAAHAWVAAATVVLDVKQAKRAVLRHSIRIPKQYRIDVLDVYCAACKRVWEDVADEPCSAAINNEHLRGGPIGERKKRGGKHTHDCAAVGCYRAVQEQMQQERAAG